MRDWLETLDSFSSSFGVGILEDSGRISHEKAVEKAHIEYDLYREKIADELTEVERAYLETLRQMQKQLSEGDVSGS